MPALGSLRIGPVLRQSQRQSQSLTMTPQLRQAIQLLQFSTLELNTWLEDQLAANPLLARDETPAERPPEAPAGAETEPLDLVAEVDMARADGIGSEAAENLWDSDGPSPGRNGGLVGDLQRSAASAPSLREQLLGQLPLLVRDQRDHSLAAQLVEQLDAAGYLPADRESLARLLGVGLARLESAIEALQAAEPTGIFARSLAECFTLQLKERDRLDPAMVALLENLDLLAKGETERLAKICAVSPDDLDDMIAEMRELDPRPGARTEEPAPAPLIPDVILRVLSGGGWSVELNPETLPRLIVDRRYYQTVAARSAGTPPANRETAQFLATRLREASWLVRALDQRARTILRVATAIVEVQRPFLERGIAHLKPLVLRDIAAAIDVHESTVSRATANKSIATPRGIFELKFFFTTAIGGGAAHSAESVRQRIRVLIDRETNILSDDAIVTVLNHEGLALARRTVAKYREAMSIPCSVERRRLRALGL